MKENQSTPNHVFIVSGSAGASGSLLVNTVLAQFHEQEVEVVLFPRVRQIDQLEKVVEKAREDGGTIVHTLVDRCMRERLVELAKQEGVIEIDLVGPIMDRFSIITGHEPTAEPGLYRRLNRAYFDRVEAIEYTMNHDDGRDPHQWSQADLVILGPSRSGKTPLSMYLAVQGWKVANLPLVPGIPITEELHKVDKRKVFGLIIDAGQLLSHRQHRQRHLGTVGPTSYSDPTAIYEEVTYAKKLYRQGEYAMINVTDKPIEASANEIVRILTRNFPSIERHFMA
jgi:[pyruvate, water dikinase]-phosphate phosphotransferase / [pyruvate, water dikinase] kinase